METEQFGPDAMKEIDENEGMPAVETVEAQSTDEFVGPDAQAEIDEAAGAGEEAAEEQKAA